MVRLGAAWTVKEAEMERIVVGVDGSEESLHAVTFAARLARETGAGVTVVYVRHIPAGYSGRPLVGPAEMERYYQMVERRVTRRVVRALTPLSVPGTWRSAVVTWPGRSSGLPASAAPTSSWSAPGGRAPSPACSPGPCRAGSSTTPTVPSWWFGDTGRHRGRPGAVPSTAAAPRGQADLVRLATLTEAAALQELGVQPHGLSYDEARVRLERLGPNRLPLARGPSLPRQFAAQLTHFFALLL
jgi:hypothetical protein